MLQVTNSAKSTVLIDARGPRFGAAITTIVFAAALATNNVWFIAVQALVFAIGAFKGPQFTPYAFVYKTIVKPRLKGEVSTEEVKRLKDRIKSIKSSLMKVEDDEQGGHSDDQT